LALVTTHGVSGAQVHDARLAAVMTASGITRILTFNVRDFIRFAGIEAIHPEQIAEVAGSGIWRTRIIGAEGRSFIGWLSGS
jgi:hypothetical protein